MSSTIMSPHYSIQPSVDTTHAKGVQAQDTPAVSIEQQYGLTFHTEHGQKRIL